MNTAIYIIVCGCLFLPLLVVSLSTSSSGSKATTTTSSTSSVPPWLRERLAAFDVQVHDFPTTGRGLQTTRDRAVDDVLIQVPESEALTVSSMLSRFPVLKQATVTSMEEDDEKLLLTDEQVLAVGLLLLRQEKDPYVMSLPQLQYSVLQMPESFLSFLPSAYRKLIQAYREHVSNLRNSICRVLPDNTTAAIVSEHDFLWAFATVRSRCVGMNGNNGNNDKPNVGTGGGGSPGEIRVMLPGFDLLNHKFGARTSPGFSSADDAEAYYVIRSNDAYTKNDQVFISYSDNRDNLKMLMTYGFIVSGNPERIILFDVQELLEACFVARPHYFSKAVLGQLWTLMGKLGKQRDMYVWDGQTKEPRETLRNGINMMAELEKQFLLTEEPDESFGADVLAALLSARQQEIARRKELLLMEQQSTTQAQQGMADHLEPWFPMMHSITVLLEEEEDYLRAKDCNAEDQGEDTSRAD